MQRTTIIGNIGQDCRIIENENGRAIGFTVAVTERFSTRNGEKKEETTWYDVLYKTQSSELPRLLKSGNKLLCEGKLTAKVWKDKNNVERIKYCLFAHNLKILCVY